MSIPIVLNLDPATESGLTLSAKVYTGSTLADTVALTESPASSARYRADWASAASSTAYDVQIVDGSNRLFGTGTFITDADGNEITLANASGDSGLSGPSSVTLTFEDGNGDAVPLVEFVIEGQGVSRANGSGLAAFGLVDDTYSIVPRTTGGVVFPITALTVDGTTTQTITGSVPSSPPAATDPDFTTAYLYTRDNSGTLSAGQTVIVQLVDPVDVSPYAWNRSNKSQTSDGSFRVEFTLPKGTQWRHKVGPQGDWSEPWTIPADAGATFEMPEILGKPGA